MNEPVALVGARCAVHAERAAASICHRCGDYICVECTDDRSGVLYCGTCLPTFRRAKLKSRAIAHAIDMALVAVPLIGALWTGVYETFGELVPPTMELIPKYLGPKELTYVIAYAASALLIAPVQGYLIHTSGQSVGKRIMNLRVVTMDGTLAGVWRVLILRNVIPGLLTQLPYLGTLFAWANAGSLLFDDQRALHDRLAGTRVVEPSK